MMNIIFKNLLSFFNQHSSLMKSYELERALEIPLTLKLSDSGRKLNNYFPFYFPVCHFLTAQVILFSSCP